MYNTTHQWCMPTGGGGDEIKTSLGLFLNFNNIKINLCGLRNPLRR